MMMINLCKSNKFKDFTDDGRGVEFRRLEIKSIVM
jgi:hypothetical protein